MEEVEEKFCNGCQKSKPKTEEYFYRRGHTLQAKCIDCQSGYHKQHYLDNIEDYKGRASERNSKLLEEIRAYIRAQKDVPCQDCGLKYPYYVMDFDHRPDEEKLYNLAEMARQKFSLEKIKQEIAKCDIVCSNCHRIRTHVRSKSSYPNG